MYEEKEKGTVKEFDFTWTIWYVRFYTFTKKHYNQT